MEYDVIIGLEIHAELKTRSKMFCSCPARSENGQEANGNTCPICLGHPGTLPLPNKQAIEDTILTGLALNCRVSKISKFDRKNYFYPDLPKGYQISQFDLPLVYSGYMDIEGERIKITRIHLEEDTGKSIHPKGKAYSLMDYNRAGLPLMEMVTEPTIKKAETAKIFCQNYQHILRYLGLSNADMEKGEMRCEANVSLQKKDKWEYRGNCEIKAKTGYELNPKIEIKNINSFKAVEKAIEYEIKRQAEALSGGKKLVQETRGWDDDKGRTKSQRLKETSADYRYFPEPDIPPLRISPEWINKIKSRLIELPQEKIERFRRQYSFSKEEAGILAGSKKVADYTEKVISELRAWINSTGDNWERQKKRLAKLTANWLISELFRYLNKSGQGMENILITPENFAELMALVHQEKINSSAGQKILKIMFEKGGDPSDIMAELGLEQINDGLKLEEAAAEIIENNKKQAEEYKAGKENVLQYFIGQVMAKTKGKANPKKAAEILRKKLNN